MTLASAYLENSATRTPDKPPFVPTTIDGADLCALDLGALRWAVDGLIPEGACILAGAPKLGKSWLALNLALAVAQGGIALGQIPVEAGPVLYLALEDGTRRLQNRLQRILSATNSPCPRGIHFATRWARCKDGGLAAIKDKIDALKPRLVIIDTLARIQDTRSLTDNAYVSDYHIIAPLQEIGLESATAIVLITHVRKKGANSTDSDDPLEEVSGTMGLTGAADVVLVLKRPRKAQAGSLFLTGRDVEERTLPLAFDPHYCLWSIDQAAEQPTLSIEQRKILAILQKAGRPLGLLQIIDSLGSDKSYEALSRQIRRMAHDGLLFKNGYGQYMSEPAELSDSDHSDSSDIDPTTLFPEPSHAEN